MGGGGVGRPEFETSPSPATVLSQDPMHIRDDTCGGGSAFGVRGLGPPWAGGGTAWLPRQHPEA